MTTPRKPSRFGDAFLSSFRWYRRWRGGRWKYWWIDVVHCYHWFQVDEWWAFTGKQPATLCRGTPRSMESWS